mmetsp:Transcript_19573/g.59212  ORF Transcript_19573/g.59212 Transcript_19573/m.59212 type:complete len:204 (+) Transcript_19573:273-884(+)
MPWGARGATSPSTGVGRASFSVSTSQTALASAAAAARCSPCTAASRAARGASKGFMAADTNSSTSVPRSATCVSPVPWRTTSDLAALSASCAASKASAVADSHSLAPMSHNSCEGTTPSACNQVASTARLAPTSIHSRWSNRLRAAASLTSAASVMSARFLSYRAPAAVAAASSPARLWAACSCSAVFTSISRHVAMLADAAA